MDLNKLRYFLVVAETEHVTQAANILGIFSLHSRVRSIGSKRS